MGGAGGNLVGAGGRWLLSGVLVLALMAAGCQPQRPATRAEAPAPVGRAEAADSTPAEALSAEPPGTGGGEQAPVEEVVVAPRPREVKKAPKAKPRRAEPPPEFRGNRSIYDPDNPDFPVLQAQEEAVRGLPLDSLGGVDWVQALRRGLIAPRGRLGGGGSTEVLDLDVLMKDTAQMPYVVFPHRAHTEWLDCSNCHPKPFEPKTGANPISMDSIFRGRDCGVCHGRVAFSVMVCERCHSVPHPGSPERWW